MKNHSVLLCILWSLLLTNTAYAQQNQAFNITTVVEDLGVPWGMVLLPEQTMLITEREGYLLKLDLGSKEITDIDGLPWDILALGQGGLLDIAFSPDYQETGWIYFSYSKNIDGQGATTLARAKLDEDSLIDWQDIFISHSTSPRSIHFAGRITFDDQGHVFLSIGDRGVRPNAQDLSNHAGTIVRLKLDGSVPQDNPFVDDNNVLDEIWSYGHRNPQGLFFNSDTKLLWSIEHGPRGGDEINLIEPGKNYGWPVISYGKEYFTPFAVGEGTHKEGMEQPLKVYTPSIAPSSLIQYQGTAFADWQGDLLSGALKLQHLNHIKLDKNNQLISEQRHLSSLNERIRNVIESPEGWLYISTDSGRILKLSPSSE